MEPQEARKLFVTKRGLRFLYCYLLILLLVGLGLVFSSLLHRESFLAVDQFERSLIGGVGTGLIGGCIYYMRKMYRSILRKTLIVDEAEERAVERIGSMMYQVVRPLFAAVFSVIIVLVLWSGLRIGIGALGGVQPPSTSDAPDAFLHATFVVTFLAGFSTARVIEGLEVGAKEVLSRTLPH